MSDLQRVGYGVLQQLQRVVHKFSFYDSVNVQNTTQYINFRHTALMSLIIPYFTFFKNMFCLGLFAPFSAFSVWSERSRQD